MGENSVRVLESINFKLYSSTIDSNRVLDPYRLPKGCQEENGRMSIRES